MKTENMTVKKKKFISVCIQQLIWHVTLKYICKIKNVYFYNDLITILSKY